MSALVVGTVSAYYPMVLQGEVCRNANRLWIGETEVAAHQGTTALLSAAVQAAQSRANAGADVVQSYSPAPIYAILATDIGHGDGTRAVYQELSRWLETGKIKELGITHIAFHYLSPVMAHITKAVSSIAKYAPNTKLIGDAGGMYAARAAGLSHLFELLTPDVGEIGFLAEPEATHPAYVAHHLFGQSQFDIDTLLCKSFELNTASRVLVVKGATDYVAVRSNDSRGFSIVATVSEPNIPALEAIGGTGDTVTGLCIGLMAKGVSTEVAAECALRANRIMGMLAQAHPATRIAKLIDSFDEALSHLGAQGGPYVSTGEMTP